MNPALLQKGWMNWATTIVLNQQDKQNRPDRLIKPKKQNECNGQNIFQ
jgi:hypothetical protein